MRHLLSITDLTPSEIDALLYEARQIEAGSNYHKVMQGSILATYFLEASTRTRISFEVAMFNLGGSVTSCPNAKNDSSASKREVLRDTVRVLGHYRNVAGIVIRHGEGFDIYNAAKFSPIPLINAGNFTDEHPSQTLVDFHYLLKRYKTLDLNYLICGDLKNGRTIHSLIKGLNLFGVKNIYIYSPNDLGLPDEYNPGLICKKINSITEVLPIIDVLYATRIQEERITPESYTAFMANYCIDNNTLDKMKPSASVLHPLPRVGELPFEIDENEHSAYFDQAAGGPEVRMAIIQMLCLKH